jgi:hypothetical protein
MSRRTTSFLSGNAIKGCRRYFRFSLRTVFLAMTVLALWLGWNLNAVHQRQTLLKKLVANRSIQVVSSDEYIARFPAGIPPLPVASVSIVRRWLGDRAIQQIWYTWYAPAAPSPEQHKRLSELFPEADIQEIPAEPCHPGCFPRGTLVTTPSGQRAIELLRPGDCVITVARGGAIETAFVHSIFRTQNKLIKISTAAGELWTTETQPIYVDAERRIPAGELKKGNLLVACHDGILEPVPIESIRPTGQRADVWNVVLAHQAKIYVANGLLVASKPPFDNPRPMATHDTNTTTTHTH